MKNLKMNAKLLQLSLYAMHGGSKIYIDKSLMTNDVKWGLNMNNSKALKSIFKVL